MIARLTLMKVILRVDNEVVLKMVHSALIT